MADQTQAQQVEQVQPEPMPSSNTVPSDNTSVETNAVQQVSGSTGNEVSSLPDDVSRRTAEQFEKLRDDLREERRRREQLEEAFTSKQQQPVVDNTPMYDPTTGYVDVNKLEATRRTAFEAQQRALSAEQKFEKYVQEQQEREAFTSYPELNPDARNHDKVLFNTTRAIITDSTMNPQDYGGKPLTAKQAADIAVKQRTKIVETAKQEAATHAIEQLTPKEQASLEATGRSDRRNDVQDRSDLVERTRRNDLDAIMQRMKAIPTAGS